MMFSFKNYNFLLLEVIGLESMKNGNSIFGEGDL